MRRLTLCCGAVYERWPAIGLRGPRPLLLATDIPEATEGIALEGLDSLRPAPTLLPPRLGSADLTAEGAVATASLVDCALATAASASRCGVAVGVGMTSCASAAGAGDSSASPPAKHTRKKREACTWSGARSAFFS